MDRVLSAWHDPQNSVARASITRENLRFVIPALVFMLVMMAMPLILARWMGGRPAVVLIGLLMLSGAWMVMHARWKSYRLGGAVRQLLIEEGLCPSCVYPLRELAPEPDGCIVCPECRAAWRVPGAAGGGEDASVRAGLWRPERSQAWYDNMPALVALTGGAFGRPRVIAVQDRSGRLVEIVHSVRAARRTPGWSEMPEASRRDLATQIRAFIGLRSAGLVVAAVIYVAYSVFLVAKVSKAPPALSVAYLSSLCPLLFFGVGAVWFGAMAFRPPIRKRQKLADLFLRRDLCPCCLTGLPGGSRLCAVCGGSWEASDRVGKRVGKRG